MDSSLEYWMKRCELAEEVINTETGSKHEIMKQINWNAFHAWCDFKNSAKAGIELEEMKCPTCGYLYVSDHNLRHKCPICKDQLINEPEKNILSFGINEIKALDLLVKEMRPDYMLDFQQSLDEISFHINNLKMLAGITEGLCSSEERERAIKFMDETILRKDNSKGFTFGYRVHESEVGITSRLHEPDEAGEIFTESFAKQMDHIKLSELKECEGNPLDSLDKCGLVESKQNLRFNFNPTQEPTIKGFHENFLKPEPTKFILEDENGSKREVNPKMSFSDFAKAYFPDNEISVHHKAIIEKLEQVAGTPNHLIIQGVRPINWYKSLAVMYETVIKLKEGKKCSVTMFGKGNYIKQMKEFFDIDVELEEICDNIYSIRLIKKEE